MEDRDVKWNYLRQSVLTKLLCRSILSSALIASPALGQDFPGNYRVPARMNDLPTRVIRTCRDAPLVQISRHSHPGLAVSMAMQKWDRVSENQGYGPFESAKSQDIRLKKLLNSAKWDAHLSGHPCT